MNATQNSIADQKSLQKMARFAGLIYFLIIFTSLLSMVFGPGKLIVPGDDSTTFNNIIDHELIFRIGALYDLIMFAGVVLLAWALFMVLKTVNRKLALLAILWRLGEAVLGCLSVLGSLIVLNLVKGENYLTGFESGQLHALVRIFLGFAPASYSIVFVFLSLGTIINCYLFYVSGYIPRILAGFGIISFLIMLISALISIVMPLTVLMALGAPAILFELIAGLWLMIKGIKVQS